MRFFFAVALTLLAFQAYSVDFAQLSRNNPITTTYLANFKCYVDVSLFVNAIDAYDGPIFLRVSYIIGDDTLNDNITINGSYNNVVKQLFLDEGERLTTIIHLNNGETEEIEGIKGSLRIVRNPEFRPTSEQGKNTFLSGVWKSDQTPLFRVSIEDSIPQIFRLKLKLNEHYEFDKLYFKMKVISPSAGILMLDKELIVNDQSTLEQREKKFTVDVDEVDLLTTGTYYFQVMQNMTGTRVNGIEKIDFEIVPQ